ncbi:MAG: hypothetical protein ACQEXE_19600 [Bacillota bacterium]|uniref:Uncharacterized protein n=1 Tax=Cytobacillus oceanisediminis 2691 TaxID=1196031 RepID=A0A160MJR4_9BACI|nr:hypothetical protein [Cytobacillus oceanisediminis]AND43128.1 hypothetical protein A361_28600 [Cytobacillus oceanisediminis 2691]MCM3245632.1 hypothetical protein [Cytobacillus oceanisediminis]USK47332.1 hypothetical protein LIT27_29605 [Cytobacillus oceanisediminis]
MPRKVLIAVGDKSYTDILINTFQQHTEDFTLSSQEVLHRRFLQEIVEIETPEILIIHDYYLESDYNRQELKDKELISFLKDMRIQFEDSLRIVYLCERPKGDPILSTIVSLGIMDIFNTNSFDLSVFVEQLKAKPQFSKVAKFLSSEIFSDTSKVKEVEHRSSEEEINENESEADENPNHEKQKQVVQKVIEKKVVQKVVNKTTIKRDYTFHVHNHNEKIVGIPVKKKLVMIGSPIERSGSTFISHLLARCLAKMGVSTTYVESPFSKSYTYDRFFGHLYSDEYKSKFYQFSKYIDPKIKSIYDWSKSEVDIICKHPTKEPLYQEEDVSFDALIKVLFSSNSTVTIMDVGTDWQYELYQDVFDIADHAYFILEPDIPFIQHFEESSEKSIEFLQKQLQSGKSSLVGNRFDKALMKNELLKDLYLEKMITHLPSFPVTDVFQAQFQGLFLNDTKDYEKQLESSLRPLLEDILPGDFLKKQKKATGVFKGLFNKKISVEKAESKGEETTV